MSLRQDSDVRSRFRETVLALVTLFTSSGTLVCCALPITLVSLGLGSAVIGLTDAAPWLITLSKHKAWVFLGSAVMLTLAGWLLYRSERSCPADPRLAALCTRLDVWNRRVFWVATGLWGLGFFAAYLLLPIYQALGG